MHTPVILQSAIRSRTSLPAKSPATAHVLVVDDDPTIAEAVTILLREDGFAVEKMTDSTQALARLARRTGAVCGARDGSRHAGDQWQRTH